MPILAAPPAVIDSGDVVTQQLDALTAEIGRLSGLVEASLLTATERRDLARLRTFYTTIRALYYAGGTISRSKVLAALNAVTAP